jgi:F-type H+-transporting ATPase subunit b
MSLSRLARIGTVKGTVTHVLAPSMRIVARSNVALPQMTMAKRWQSDRPLPRDKALSIINAAPGNGMLQKTGFISVAAGLAAYAISKELYIVDVETLEAICMLGAFAVWYVSGKDVARDYFEDQKARIRNLLTQAREDHKAVVQERIDHVNQLGDIGEVTKSMYEMSRQIAKMEAEAYELKQEVAFRTEIKNTLDAWVRYEANVRESQQKSAVNHLIQSVTAQLQNDDVQKKLLNQAIAEVESTSNSRNKGC